MDIVKKIARETLLELQSLNRLDSPDEYGRIFCQKAKENGVAIEDCQKLRNFLLRLKGDLKKEAHERNIRQPDELFAFLLGYIERQNVSVLKEQNKSLLRLTLLLLHAIGQIPKKELQQQALHTRQKLDGSVSAKSVDSLSVSWKELNIPKLFAELEMIREKQKIAPQDIGLVLKILEERLEGPRPEEMLSQIAYVIRQSLTPSILDVQNKERKQLEQMLREKPSWLMQEEFIDRLEHYHEQRVSFDRQEYVGGVRKVKDSLLNVETKLERLRDQVKQREMADPGLVKQEERAGIASGVMELSEELEKVWSEIETLEETLKREEWEMESLEVEDGLSVLSGPMDSSETDFQKERRNYHLAAFYIQNLDEIERAYGAEAAKKARASFDKLFVRYDQKDRPFEEIGGVFIVLLKHGEPAEEFVGAFASLVNESKFAYRNIQFSLKVTSQIASRVEFDSPQAMLEALLDAE